MRFLGEIVKHKIENSYRQQASGFSGAIKGKVYGNAAGRVADSVAHKAIELVDCKRNELKRPNTKAELLSRNPDHSKFLIRMEINGSVRVIGFEDDIEILKYTIESASSSKWIVRNSRRKKIGKIIKQRPRIADAFRRKTKPQTYRLFLHGENVGSLNTRTESDIRIGTTTFNHWSIWENKIASGDTQIASVNRIRGILDNGFVIDYSSDVDGLLVFMLIYTMRQYEKST